MKLKQIKSLKGYKSFIDFSWQPYFNNEDLHEKVNILFGENGSGKSTICNTLKCVSGVKEFEKYQPAEVSLLFADGEKKYPVNNSWDNTIAKGNILFFDREFVDKNIHLGHNRVRQQGGHEQESGKLIIEFDSEAIKLRSDREIYRSAKDSQEKIEEDFRTQNDETLNFTLTDDVKPYYDQYKGKTEDEIKEIKIQLIQEHKSLKQLLDADISRQKKTTEIQNIEEVEYDEVDNALSVYVIYQALFDFNLEDPQKIQIESNLIENIRKRKTFYETGIEIRKTYPDVCPFCQSKDEEENIKKVIQAYNDIFNETYKIKYNEFQSNKKALVNELETLQKQLSGFDVNSIFLKFKKIQEDHKIENIYSVDEEKTYEKPKMYKIEELKNIIIKLDKPNKENIKKPYEQMLAEYQIIEKYFSDIAILIDGKNKLIRKYKTDNTDIKLQNRIAECKVKIGIIEKQITTLDNNIIDKQKKKEQAEKDLKEIEAKVKTTISEYKKAKEKYEEYCLKDIFAKPIKGMLEYFKKFNFNFNLALETEKRKTGTTKEFPFAFTVLDAEGAERDFKEGLSEGELQVLSLCFFFAFLDIQNDKNNKVLVFDDPITSLDNSNLSCLVDLIGEEQNNYSQTLIFTHHRTFFKFLKKKFKDNSNEYNILRNKKEYGGSFVCKSKSEKFLNKLQGFENHLQRIPPESLDVELKIVEYGQYLRYETERFIKNNLLHWNANDFTTAIDGVKKNKHIADADLDTIKQVYSFCNWTTSHVDVGDDHGLEQLKSKINDLLRIVPSSQNT